MSGEDRSFRRDALASGDVARSARPAAAQAAPRRGQASARLEAIPPPAGSAAVATGAARPASGAARFIRRSSSSGCLTNASRSGAGTGGGASGGGLGPDPRRARLVGRPPAQRSSQEPCPEGAAQSSARPLAFERSERGCERPRATGGAETEVRPPVARARAAAPSTGGAPRGPFFGSPRAPAGAENVGNSLLDRRAKRSKIDLNDDANVSDRPRDPRPAEAPLACSSGALPSAAPCSARSRAASLPSASACSPSSSFLSSSPCLSSFPRLPRLLSLPFASPAPPVRNLARLVASSSARGAASARASTAWRQVRAACAGRVPLRLADWEDAASAAAATAAAGAAPRTRDALRAGDLEGARRAAWRRALQLSAPSADPVPGPLAPPAGLLWHPGTGTLVEADGRGALRTWPGGARGAGRRDPIRTPPLDGAWLQAPSGPDRASWGNVQGRTQRRLRGAALAEASDATRAPDRARIVGADPSAPSAATRAPERDPLAARSGPRPVGAFAPCAFGPMASVQRVVWADAGCASRARREPPPGAGVCQLWNPGSPSPTLQHTPDWAPWSSSLSTDLLLGGINCASPEEPSTRARVDLVPLERTDARGLVVGLATAEDVGEPERRAMHVTALLGTDLDAAHGAGHLVWAGLHLGAVVAWDPRDRGDAPVLAIPTGSAAAVLPAVQPPNAGWPRDPAHSDRLTLFPTEASKSLFKLLWSGNPAVVDIARDESTLLVAHRAGVVRIWDLRVASSRPGGGGGAGAVEIRVPTATSAAERATPASRISARAYDPCAAVRRVAPVVATFGASITGRARALAQRPAPQRRPETSGTGPEAAKREPAADAASPSSDRSLYVSDRPRLLETVFVERESQLAFADARARGGRRSTGEQPRGWGCPSLLGGRRTIAEHARAAEASRTFLHATSVGAHGGPAPRPFIAPGARECVGAAEVPAFLAGRSARSAGDAGAGAAVAFRSRTAHGSSSTLDSDDNARSSSGAPTDSSEASRDGLSRSSSEEGGLERWGAGEGVRERRSASPSAPAEPGEGGAAALGRASRRGPLQQRSLFDSVSRDPRGRARQGEEEGVRGRETGVEAPSAWPGLSSPPLVSSAPRWRPGREAPLPAHAIPHSGVCVHDAGATSARPAAAERLPEPWALEHASFDALNPSRLAVQCFGGHVAVFDLARGTNRVSCSYVAPASLEEPEPEALEAVEGSAALSTARGEGREGLGGASGPSERSLGVLDQSSGSSSFSGPARSVLAGSWLPLGFPWGDDPPPALGAFRDALGTDFSGLPRARGAWAESGAFVVPGPGGEGLVSIDASARGDAAWGPAPAAQLAWSGRAVAIAASPTGGGLAVASCGDERRVVLLQRHGE